MQIESRMLFNFIKGSNISGESSFDIWKAVTGNSNENDFLEYLQTGPKGDSAYQIWLNAGNEGTEEDFLNWYNRYTDEQIAAEVTARNEAIATAKSGAETTAKSYTDSRITAEVTARNEAIDTANSSVEEVAKSYTDSKIADEVTARNNAIATAKNEAINTSKTYVDGKFDAIMGEGASETLNTIGEISKAIEDHHDVTDTLNAAIGNKVDKVSGKGLSTNDYTTAEKDKLSGIANNANNYSHPTTSGNKHIPSGGASGQVLLYSSDGNAAWNYGNDIMIDYSQIAFDTTEII